MSLSNRYPKFAIISAGILAVSFVIGQSWLHRTASPQAIAHANAALVQCGAEPAEIVTYWDIVRAYDRSYLHTIAKFIGIDGPC